MVYTYTPTYYSSLHDSITSLCKTILPFSALKKRRVPAIAAAEQRLSKQQSDNLKWQQESFHQILNLMGLCKEGILPETEVSVFRSHLLDTMIASPLDHEQPVILRDKLIFLQELLYAKCISEDEYHSSKRPLLQRLAIQGAEIEARNVIIGVPKPNSDEGEGEGEGEGWSVIDLKDEQCMLTKQSSSSKMKQIKGTTSVFNFMKLQKNGKIKEDKNELGVSQENPFWDGHMREKERETKSILMAESLPLENVRKKPYRTLCQKEDREKKEKSHWGFDGFKKWKKGDSEDETAPLSVGEGPDSKQIIKRKLNADDASPSDKVLGDKIKKELSRIQTELNSKSPNSQFSNDQIEAISTRLPVDKAELKKFFPKSWCDRNGDVVLDVVRKEFKDHVGEMKNLQNANREKKKNNSKRWATFDDNYDDENCHPNLFDPHQGHSFPMKQAKSTPNNNPFFDD